MFSRFRNQLTGRVHAMLFPESKVLEKNFPIFVPASWNASESESLTIILSGASFLRERGKNCFEREEIQRWKRKMMNTETVFERFVDKNDTFISFHFVSGNHAREIYLK